MLTLELIYRVDESGLASHLSRVWLWEGPRGPSSCQISGLKFRVCHGEMALHIRGAGGGDSVRDQFRDEEAPSRPGAVGERRRRRKEVRSESASMKKP